MRTAQNETILLAERHRAFGRLVARYQDMAFGAAYSFLRDVVRAEDAAQEALIAAWRSLPALRTPEAFPAWLSSLVRTACNRQTRRCSLPTVPLEVNASFLLTPGPHESVEQQERSALVQEAIATLPEPERLSIILFHIADYSREEVAAFLGVSLVTVKRRLASARSKLRERLLIMLQEDLQKSRPSNSDMFAARVLAFTKLFRVLIDNGNSLVHSLNQAAAQEEDTAFRTVIEEVSRAIESGHSLSGAMRKYPHWFSPEYIRAIREGEVMGKLEVILAGLADGTYTAGQIVLIYRPDDDDVGPWAVAEARSRGQAEVMPEHVLLALLKREECVRELDAAGINRMALRVAVETHLDSLPSGEGTEHFSDTVRAIWSGARQVAVAEDADLIHTRHLLEAISAFSSTYAARLLREHAPSRGQ